MDWQALGGDPAPGDVDGVRQVAYAFRTVERDADAAADRISGLLGRAGAGVWTGPAAEAFRERLAKTLPDLRKLAESHGLADRALLAYADDLDRAQAQARVAAGRASTAQLDLDRGDRLLQAARAETARTAASASRAATTARASRLQTFSPAAALADPTEQVRLQQQATADEAYRSQRDAAAAEARHREAAAARAVDRAEAELIAARRLGMQAAEVHEEAGQQVVRRLGEASAAGIRNRSALRRWWDDRVEDLREITATPEFHRYLEILSLTSDVLAAAAFVAALVPVGGTAVAGVLLAASAGTAVAVAALTVLARALGNARTSDAVLAVAAAIPLVGKVIKHGKTGVLLGGKIKRALSYGDARRATGWFRKFHAAPKLVPDRWNRLPVRILGPERFFQAKVGYEVADGIRKTAGTILDLSRIGEPQPPENSWKHRVIDGIEDHLRAKAGR